MKIDMVSAGRGVNCRETFIFDCRDSNNKTVQCFDDLDVKWTTKYACNAASLFGSRVES